MKTTAAQLHAIAAMQTAAAKVHAVAAMQTAGAQVHAVAAHYGEWLSYGGTARLALAVALLVIAAGVAFAAIRLRLPVGPARPSAAARKVRLWTWLVALAVLLACTAADLKHMAAEHLLRALPADNVAPVTFTGVTVIFLIVVIFASSRGLTARVGLTSAAIAAMAAPMIFEFPFDLIVMARTYPPIPPDPALYRALFFAPLLLVEVTTLALLTLSPMVRLSRPALLCFALMLAVFAVWALFGFVYPSGPVPFAFNAVSKILALAAGFCLFLPQRDAAGTVRQASGAHASLVQAGHERV